ncbi:hypothetical protein F2Q69_00057761 [Brassica cretica]|nr:hypothetical protein F2Q69_00057761 [Brassica cretica]
MANLFISVSLLEKTATALAVRLRVEENRRHLSPSEVLLVAANRRHLSPSVVL